MDGFIGAALGGVFVNEQGHFIDMAPMNKPGKYNIRIDGYSFGKWTSSKQLLYWRCSRAQAIGCKARARIKNAEGMRSIHVVWPYHNHDVNE